MADSCEFNVFATSPEGFPVHVKLAGVTVYGDAQRLLHQLQADGFTPGSAPGQRRPSTKRESAPAGPPCPVHGVPLRTYSRDGQTWQAHRQGDSWCHAAKKESERAS